jgi:hypothetical protein
MGNSLRTVYNQIPFRQIPIRIWMSGYQGGFHFDRQPYEAKAQDVKGSETRPGALKG